MTTTTARPMTNSLTTGRLPRWLPWVLLAGSWVVAGVHTFGSLQQNEGLRLSAGLFELMSRWKQHQPGV